MMMAGTILGFCEQEHVIVSSYEGIRNVNINEMKFQSDSFCLSISPMASRCPRIDFGFSL